jgi:hypothetical protein
MVWGGLCLGVGGEELVGGRFDEEVGRRRGQLNVYDDVHGTPSSFLALHTQAFLSSNYCHTNTGMELTITDAATVLSDAYEGCSIAVNGVCLTVVTFTRMSSLFSLPLIPFLLIPALPLSSRFSALCFSLFVVSHFFPFLCQYGNHLSTKFSPPSFPLIQRTPSQ